MNDQPALYDVSPVLAERKCGGWMAFSPRGWPLGIAVCADTEANAKAEFRAALSRWADIHLAPMDVEPDRWRESRRDRATTQIS